MMKHFPKLAASLLISLLLCIPSSLAVFYYTQPMEDVSYPLFQFAEDGGEWAGDEGWTFYTNEKGRVTELASDGSGGYLGLSKPGQTFYYSRILTEDADSPTLRIDAVNRTVSVFLDDTIIYTDCPEEDSRMGYLTLPMLEYDRMEPVTISLPPEYHGRTLTIAQSSPENSELQEDTAGTVWPCEVTLYCGYAYESSLVASAAKTMLPAVLLFALSIFFLAIFIWNASVGILSLKIPVFALAVLLQMCSVLAKADFFFQYFGTPPVDLVLLCFHLSVGTLLLFLALYAKDLPWLFWTAALLQWLSAVLYFITQTGRILEYGELYVFFMELPQLVGFFALLAALSGSFFLRKKSRFFRHLTQAAYVLMGGYAVFLLASILFAPGYTADVLTRLKDEMALRLPNFSLRLLWDLCLLSSLAATAAELAEQEMQRRTDHAILVAKNRLAVESYENLRLQSEEVMMLRHDTMKHYTLLQTMAKEAPEHLPHYLDELIGQAEDIRPVLSSKNRILNILLNGKLYAASEKGISIEIVRTEAPEELPLTDAELCSLFINILDNAISAASDPRAREHAIRLDFHCNDLHFIFSCENSMVPKAMGDKKTPTPRHGYGLKIIRQIMSRFGENMLLTEQSDTTYKITVVVPLSS